LTLDVIQNIEWDRQIVRFKRPGLKEFRRVAKVLGVDLQALGTSADRHVGQPRTEQFLEDRADLFAERSGERDQVRRLL
jgi:hypothetical protein